MKQASIQRKSLSKTQHQRINSNIMNHQTAQKGDIHDRLTAREREIFHMTALGLSSGQIASRCLISPRTVETHRENIMKKLGVNGKAELIFYAFRHGWVV